MQAASRGPRAQQLLLGNGKGAEFEAPKRPHLQAAWRSMSRCVSATPLELR